MAKEKEVLIPVTQSTDAKKFNAEKVDAPNQAVPRMGIARDPRAVVREIYNLTGEEIIVSANPPARGQPWAYHPRHPKFPGRVFGPQHWDDRILKAGEWMYCPHFFLTFRTKSGRPVELLEIFGDQMFTGETKPSRPEVKKNQFFL